MQQPQDPNAVPDTVIFDAFDGIKNTVSRERLGPRDLEKAVNIDLDDSGQPRRRRGYEPALDGEWHSIKGPLAGKTYGVRDGYLGIIRPLPDFFSLGIYIGTEPVAYTEVDNIVYFSSDSMSGVVSQAEVVNSWGATDGQGFWDTPVSIPTETLGEVAGQLLGDPPKARCLAAYKGRIYLAAEKTLWATELFRYHYVDRTKNFMQFEHEITLLMAVADGLYVGTTGGLYFIQGMLGTFKLQQITSGAVLFGSGVEVPSQLIHPQARSQDMPTSIAAVMMTADGILAGFDGGDVFNLTQTRVMLPSGVSAAGLFRQDQGANSYVTVVDSAGAPTSTARIGDYIDAELIRAVDRQGG
jgi:hypothetical protein